MSDKITNILDHMVGDVLRFQNGDKSALRNIREYETEILDVIKPLMCNHCAMGSPAGKIIDGTAINGLYAHRFEDHNAVCGADRLLRGLE